MPSQRERARNNVRAGVFVTVCLILFVCVLFILTDAWAAVTAKTARHTVRFTVAGGVAKIEPGAKVLVGGVPLGRVVDIEPRIEAGGPFREIDVIFELDDRINIYRDAKIRIATALIGSEAWLEVSSVGTEGAPEGGVVRGHSSTRLLDAVLGPEGAGKTDDILDDVAATVENARHVTETVRESADEVADDVKTVTGDARAMMEEIRGETWPSWADRVDRVLDWSLEASHAIDAIFADGRELVSDARGVVAESREAVEEVRPSITRTTENIEAASDDVRALTLRAREEMANKLDRMLDTGTRALDAAEAAVEDVRGGARGWMPTVDDTLADARLAAQQLKLALTEIRRNPWKVLYQPAPSELEHELLYEAARTFAVAAADLKGASSSIERVMEVYPDRVQEGDETFAYLRQRLLDALTRYDDAQRRLFDVLRLDAAP